MGIICNGNISAAVNAIITKLEIIVGHATLRLSTRFGDDWTSHLVKFPDFCLAAIVLWVLLSRAPLSWALSVVRGDSRQWGLAPGRLGPRS